MTDNINPTNPAEPVQVAPVSPTPESVPTPAPTVETPAPAPAETPAPASPEAPVETEPSKSILSEALEKDPAETPGETPKETPKEGETPKEAPKEEAPKEEIKQEGQSDEPAPPPTFDEFTFPEGIQAEGELLKEFTSVLGQLELDTKADHAKMQEFGQKAVDLYTREVQKAVDSVNRLYQTNWENVKTKWKDEFLNDPELGGNRAQTTLDAARGFIRNFGGTPEEQKEFRQLLDQSGIGNHKIVIRLLANAGRALSEGRPLAANTPVNVTKSKVETLYSGKRYIS